MSVTATALSGDALVAKAEEIAREAHEGQRRWTGESFITHPAAVAAAVCRELQGDPLELRSRAVAAAWLHDVLEDTRVTADDLLAAGVPPEVVGEVLALTHGHGETYLTYLLRLRTHVPARLVKLADIRHNKSTNPRNTGYQRVTQDKWDLAERLLTEFTEPGSDGGSPAGADAAE